MGRKFRLATIALVVKSNSVDSFIPQIIWGNRLRLLAEKRSGYKSQSAIISLGDIDFLPIEQYNKLASRHPRIADRISHRSFSARPVEEWLCVYLSLSESDKTKLYSRWPNGTDCIKRLGRHRIHQWLSFFLSEVGLDHGQLRELILSRPQLLSYKLSNIQSTVSYFAEELGLSSNEFASLLRIYPSVLMYSIDKRLRPTVQFLQIECGGGKDNWTSWKRVIYNYPHVFSHSLEKTLLPKVNFLCRRTSTKGGGRKNYSLGLKRSELSQVVGKFPPTLWLSEENLQSKFDFFSESLDLKRSELRTMIVSYPQILGLSLEKNLIPKMDFFLDTNERGDGNVIAETANLSINCGLSKKQLKEFVLYQPALLAYSLENRLKPRISRMQEKKIFFYYCPKNIMSYTDKKFDSWMSTQVATWSISE